MPRYIDADALLESGICVEYGYNDNGLLLIPMRDVTNSIRNAPTIDAEPVRHGRWVERGYVCGETEWECTSCGNTEWRTSASRLKWCPFCGAKMDGGKDDENA